MRQSRAQQVQHSGPALLRESETINFHVAFGDVKAVLFDGDEVLFRSERQQQRGWLFAVEQLLTMCGLPVTAVFRHELRVVITEIFEHALFNQLTTRVFELLERHGVRPFHIETPEDLDAALIYGRADFMREYAKKQNIALPGVLKLILSLRQCGIELGLYTNSPLPVSMACIRPTYGDDFNRYIPPRNRIYREQVVNIAGLRSLKPNPWGYVTLAGRMGFDPAQCVIIDDRANACFGALEAGFHIINPTYQCPKALADYAMRFAAADHSLRRFARMVTDLTHVHVDRRRKR